MFDEKKSPADWIFQVRSQSGGHPTRKQKSAKKAADLGNGAASLRGGLDVGGGEATKAANLGKGAASQTRRPPRKQKVAKKKVARLGSGGTSQTRRPTRKRKVVKKKHLTLQRTFRSHPGRH